MQGGESCVASPADGIVVCWAADIHVVEDLLWGGRAEITGDVTAAQRKKLKIQVLLQVTDQTISLKF